MNPALYILMRSDLGSMNTGKAIAQGGHAVSNFHETVAETRQKIDASTMREKAGNNWSKQIEAFDLWKEMTDQHFGTKLAVSVTLMQLTDVWATTVMKRWFTGLITDPTYPYIVDSDVARLIDPATHSAEPVFLPNGKVLLCRKEKTCGYVFVADKNSEDAVKLLGGLSLFP